MNSSDRFCFGHPGQYDVLLANKFGKAQARLTLSEVARRGPVDSLANVLHCQARGDLQVRALKDHRGPHWTAMGTFDGDRFALLVPTLAHVKSPKHVLSWPFQARKGQSYVVLRTGWEPQKGSFGPELV